MCLLDPDYKVIVLFRDPRAIETSISVSPDPWTKELTNEFYMCSKIVKNYKTFEKMKNFKSRIKMIKYEDFVENKFDTIHTIYNFLNITYLMKYPEKAVGKHFKDVIEKKWDKVLEGEVIPKHRTNTHNKFYNSLKSKYPKSSPMIIEKKFMLQKHKKLPIDFMTLYKSIPSQRRRNFFKVKKLNTIVVGNTFRYYSTFRSKQFRHDHWKNEISKTLLDTIQNSQMCRQAMENLEYQYYNMTSEILL